MVKDLLYPILQAHNPIFTSQHPILQFLEPGFVSKLANSSGENKREK